ncbi:hypothetical protein BCR43DRAFT_497130 [Syncephalastrum racemosum]|uniref:Uncharacterized protein n=1 Tax=Syncephalastrum racemosum TaxID=13706 RepID=A0A1X2H599_SYNRA|nr:hypothetical protein BCR43DRAFT_497130 [Syncephalastrum racemosum]
MPSLLQKRVWCLLLFLSVAHAQESPTTAAESPVSTHGWNGTSNNPPAEHKSWLAQHGRFAFVIVLGVLVLALLIWYIVRSIRGMRKRLQRENENQMAVIQHISDAQATNMDQKQQFSNNNHHEYPSADYMLPPTTHQPPATHHHHTPSTSSPISPVTPTTPPPRY